MSSFDDLAPLFICVERGSLTVLPLIIRGAKALHRQNSVAFSENITQRNFPLPILWAENLPVMYKSVELDKAIKKQLSPLFDCPVHVGREEPRHMAATWACTCQHCAAAVCRCVQLPVLPEDKHRAKSEVKHKAWEVHVSWRPLCQQGTWPCREGYDNSKYLSCGWRGTKNGHGQWMSNPGKATLFALPLRWTGVKHTRSWDSEIFRRGISQFNQSDVHLTCEIMSPCYVNRFNPGRAHSIILGNNIDKDRTKHLPFLLKPQLYKHVWPGKCLSATALPTVMKHLENVQSDWAWSSSG